MQRLRDHELTADIQILGILRHHNLTLPTVTPMDLIVHGVNTLTCDLQDAPTIACKNQLAAI